MTDQQMILPGIKPVLELLHEHPEKIDLVLCRANSKSKDIGEIIALCKQHSIHFSFVEKELLDKRCARKASEGSSAHQGVLARLVPFSFTPLETVATQVESAPLPLLLALDDVQDPGNVGTLVRTLYALGAAGLLIPNHNTAHLGPAAHKASAGALERLPIVRVPHLGRALDYLEEQGLAIYGSAQENAMGGSANALTTPMNLPAVLVLGNEARGLRPDIKKRCQTLLAIPQERRINSINVAQAGAILLGATVIFRKNANLLLNSL
ncbi:MAG: RNA methyltransferase [Desulfovibrionaceae bacterium]|nr:RNA methyltransferase [Desulfovibrionaceae bacterium]